jgi:hypothetical protein
MPFYIGRGSKLRPYNFRNRPALWRAVHDECGVIVTIIHEGLTEDESKLVERVAITEYRELYGSYMINVAGGGDDGPSNGVRLFYTDTECMVLRGYNQVVANGFAYGEVCRIANSGVGRIGSKLFLNSGGKRKLFNVLKFDNRIDCDRFINENNFRMLEIFNA